MSRLEWWSDTGWEWCSQITRQWTCSQFVHFPLKDWVLHRTRVYGDPKSVLLSRLSKCFSLLISLESPSTGAAGDPPEEQGKVFSQEPHRDTIHDVWVGGLVLSTTVGENVRVSIVRVSMSRLLTLDGWTFRVVRELWYPERVTSSEKECPCQTMVVVRRW